MNGMKFMMKKIMIIVSLIVLFLDIISKLLVSHCLIVNESIKIINNFLYLTYVENDGVAFSLLGGSRILIIIMCLIILGFIVYYIRNNKISLLDSVGFGLVIGGAVGNLIDRVIYGYVIDFIDAYIFGYNYPIFNVADMGVVIGVIIILISSFMKERSVLNGNNRG